MCRPLGQDLERRRYWVLGEAAAAWRVYVEEQNGTLWGWYDGESPAKRQLLAFQEAAMFLLCCA